jgi:hypothetical protein
MKRFFSKAILVVAVASITAMVHAQTPSQTPSVDYGRTTVQFNSNFANFMQSVGVVITNLEGIPLQNNTFTVQAVSGSVDLTTSAGEIEHTGGLFILAAGNVIRIQDLTIDTTTPTAPVITAEFIINDHFSSRIPLFNIQLPAPLTLPLQPQTGVLQENGLILTLSPAMASLLNTLFGGPVLQAGSNVGTANAYVVLAPSN